MNLIRAKTPRLRLDHDTYQQLCRQILERDGWRCQACGTLQNLQVHHRQFRSRSGDDSEGNLITLCIACHSATHLDARSAVTRSVRANDDKRKRSA